MQTADEALNLLTEGNTRFAEGKSIYLNRTIFDADVILPIGCMRLETSLGYHGIYGDLFPAFSDEETLRRFRAPSNENSVLLRRRRRQEVDEVGWLLGVALSVQVQRRESVVTESTPGLAGGLGPWCSWAPTSKPSPAPS